MAMTAAQQKDAYQFFIIAFGAAPGTVYMDQLNDAYGAGMTTKQIVNVYTTKPQFTALYPNFLSNNEFATSLINNVVKSSASDAAKLQAIADVEGALAFGMTRGDVIYQVFTNLSNLVGDATWGGTAALLQNQVAVAEYYTETLLGNATDMATLRATVSGVTATSDVSSSAAIDALLAGPVATVFTLTTDSETILGNAGANLITGTEKTLAFDQIDGGTGVDTLRLVIGTEGMNGSLGETVKNVEEVVIQTLGGITTDISGYTGVQNVNVTAVNGANVDLTSAAAESVTIKASRGDVELTDKTAKVIDVAAGGYANVTAGDATSITVNVGDSEGYGADVKAGDVGTATVTSAESSVLVTVGSAGSINASSGSYESEGAVYGYDAVVNVAGNVEQVKVDAGGIGRVVVGSAGSITVKSGYYTVEVNGEVVNEEGYDAVVKSTGNVGSINMIAGADGRIDVGVIGSVNNFNGFTIQEAVEAVATVEANAGTINVTAKEIARVQVAGSVETLTIDADKVAVQVGVFGQESTINNDVKSAGLATTVGTAGAIDVTSARAAEVYVTGNVGSLAVDAGGNVDIVIGVEGEEASSYVNGEQTSSDSGLATTVSSVDTIDVTTTKFADIYVTGNAGTITVDAANGADIEVGVWGDAVSSSTSFGNSSEYQGLAAVASTVEAIKVTSTGEDSEGVDVEVLGNVGSIAIVSSYDVDIEVGYEGSSASNFDYGFYKGQDAGQATVASTVQTINVISSDDTDIEVIGSVGTVKVAAGENVYINVGYEGYEGDFNEETNLGSKDIAAVISNVGSIEVAAGNDVTIDITGNAGQVTLAVGADVEHHSEVNVNVGGTIDALSITGAEGQNWSNQAVDVVAGAITALSLTDVSRAEVSDNLEADVADAELVRNAENAENVSIELTSASATSLNLTVAGVIANLSVANSAEVTTAAEVEGDLDVVTQVNLETLSLTVNEYRLTGTEDVVTTVNDLPVHTPAPYSFIVDSEINLQSEEVKTLNVAGAGNLLLDVAAANALNLIDAHTATGNITVELDGNDAVSYLGGAGVDTVTLTDVLATQVDDVLTLNVVETTPSYTLNGGAGNADALKLTATLAATASNAGFAVGSVTNFEILNLTDVAVSVDESSEGLTIDATKFGTNHVVLDSVAAYGDSSNLLSLNIADGGTVELKGVGTLDVTVAKASETDKGSLSLVLNGSDTHTSVLGAESIAIASNGSEFNALGLNAASAKTITITGEAFLDLTDNADALLAEYFGGSINAPYIGSESNLINVTTISAAGFNAGLIVDLSANASAASITVGNGFNFIIGTQGNDTITVGNGSKSLFPFAVQAADTADIDVDANPDLNIDTRLDSDEVFSIGNVIEGGAGKDTINLAAGKTADVLVYNAAIHSNGSNMDVVNGFQASFVAGQVTRMVGEGDAAVETSYDVIGHDLFNFSGVLNEAYAAAELGGQMASEWIYSGYQGEADGYGAVLTSLQAGEVRYVLDSTTSMLYVDADASGTLGNNDLLIKLTGVTDLEAANFDSAMFNFA